MLKTFICKFFFFSIYVKVNVTYVYMSVFFTALGLFSLQNCLILI